MASTSPRKSLTLCTKCLLLADKLKTLSCLHVFCKDCIKKFAKDNLNSSITCPYCSKVTVLPFDGVKALPDHFRPKLQIGNKVKPESETKKNGEPIKPKEMGQIKNDWNSYYSQLQEDLMLVQQAIRAPPKKESPVEEQIKDMRKIRAQMDKMSAQTAIQRALVAGDILKANLALTKGKTAPHVEEVSEECYNLLLDIHGQKVEQVDFAIDHTQKTKVMFEENIAKIRKDLRDEADALMVKFVRQVEDNLARDLEEVQMYETKSYGKIEEQMKQLMDQKTHIEKVLDWAPKAKSEETRKVAYSAMLVTQVRIPKASLSDRKLCNMKLQKASSFEFTEGSLSLDYSLVGSGTWSLTQQLIGGSRPKSSVGIAIGAEGQIAVTDMDRSLVRVFRNDGMLEAEFTVTLGRMFRTKMLPSSLLISPNGHYIIAENSHFVKVYNTQGKCQYQFIAMSPNNRPSDAIEDTKLGSLAMDNHGNLLVGDTQHGYISIMSHDPSSQHKVRHLRSIDTGIEPHFMAVNSHHYILVSNYKTVSLLDSTGEFIFDLTAPVYVSKWIPSGVCFTQDDEIVVANGSETKDAGIFRYSASGIYLGCITREVKCPYGIALTENDTKLVVADSYNVKVFNLA